MSDNDSEKKQSRFEQLPLQTRRNIFWVSLIVAVCVIIGAWLFFLDLTIDIPDKDDPRQQQLEEIRDDLKKILENTNQGFEDVKNQLNQNQEQLLGGETATTTEAATINSDN